MCMAKCERSARNARKRVAVVAACVRMAGSDLAARNAGKRVAVVAACVRMAGRSRSARNARKRVAVVAACVRMAGRSRSARRVAASKSRPCFQPKTKLSRANPTVWPLLRPLLLLQRVCEPRAGLTRLLLTVCHVLPAKDDAAVLPAKDCAAVLSAQDQAEQANLNGVILVATLTFVVARL